jgi:hypothetical protein
MKTLHTLCASNTRSLTVNASGTYSYRSALEAYIAIMIAHCRISRLFPIKLSNDWPDFSFPNGMLRTLYVGGRNKIPIFVFHRLSRGVLSPSQRTPWRCMGGEPNVQLLFGLHRGTTSALVVSLTLRPRFTPGEITVHGDHQTGDSVIPKPVWKQMLEEKSFALAENRTPGGPVRSQ